MLKDTAILIFSRTAGQEVLHKQLADNGQTNASLCQALHNQTINTAAKTNLPILDYSKQQQSGNCFAHNITEAIAMGFSKGYKHLIVIGADCPNLTKNHLTTAYIALQQGNNVVAGQDRRGGIYLLGISKNVFEAASFLQFSWQTNKLFGEIKNYASLYNFLRLNAVLSDINSKNDVVKSMSLFQCNIAWRSLLLEFSLFVKVIQFKNALFIDAFTFTSTQILRGPPSVCQ
ncbi:MAG: DUF2064 domain-containing protein [Ferruginibacter sp.]